MADSTRQRTGSETGSGAFTGHDVAPLYYDLSPRIVSLIFIPLEKHKSMVWHSFIGLRAWFVSSLAMMND